MKWQTRISYEKEDLSGRAIVRLYGRQYNQINIFLRVGSQ